MYWGDYVKDTLHLTVDEHGAYLLLLAAYWINGKPLPDDDKQLARIARVTLKKWKSLSPRVRDFFSARDGHLIHKRVEKELLKCSERSSKARASALLRARSTTTVTDSSVSAPDSESAIPPHALHGTPHGGTNGHTKPKANRRKPAVPLPDNWEPDLEYARGIGMNDREINWQANSMCDRARMKDERFADWQARWRNWCRTFVNTRDNRGPH